MPENPAYLHFTPNETIDGIEVTRYPYFLRSMEVLAYGGGILPKIRPLPCHQAVKSASGWPIA